MGIYGFDESHKPSPNLRLFPCGCDKLTYGYDTMKISTPFINLDSVIFSRVDASRKYGVQMLGENAGERWRGVLSDEDWSKDSVEIIVHHFH